MLSGRLEHVGDLQILDCELNKNAFGGRAPLRPAGKGRVLPQIF